MPTHVGVPGVGVGNVGIRGVRRHLQINAKGLQRRIGIGQAAGDAKGRRVIARFTEAVDVSFNELPQLRDEVFDMDSGSAVDIRGPFSGQDRCSHVASLERVRDPTRGQNTHRQEYVKESATVKLSSCRILTSHWVNGVPSGRTNDRRRK